MDVNRPETAADDSPAACEVVADQAGRDRLVRNVLASWGGHFAFLLAGFIMPRLVDAHLGQAALGVWDFAWSLISYLGLVQVGIVSSVARYVAKYRAAEDAEGVSEVVSSVSLILLAMATVVLGLSIAAAAVVPGLLSGQLGSHVSDARWVLFLVGLTLTVQIAGAGIGGVVTGCHRWDIHNALHAGGRVLSVIGMIAALLLGGGLRELALMNLCGEVVARIARCVVAYRVYPELRIGVRCATLAMAWRMFRFGNKSFFFHMGRSLVNQAAGILIMAYMGPALLALYSRPMALIMHAAVLVRKFALVLTPATSSLQAMGKQREVRELLVKSTRYAGYIAVPLVLTLAILGRAVLRFWMGPHYEDGMLIAILAVGYLPVMVQWPTYNILAGLNLHGRPAVANLLAAAIGAGMLVLATAVMRWGLVGVAIAITAPFAIANGLFIPLDACRRLGLSFSRYILDALRGPVLCAIPFAFCLAVAHAAFVRRAMGVMAGSTLTGVLVLAVLYWLYAVPASWRRKAARWAGRSMSEGRAGCDLHRGARQRGTAK